MPLNAPSDDNKANSGHAAREKSRAPRGERRVERALVLRRFAFGETSLIAQVLSEQTGRVHLVAKGAYRPKSATYGILDLFDTLELEWFHGPARELQTLSRGTLVQRRRALSEDLERYRAGLTALELTGVAAQPGADSRSLFANLSACLDGLTQPDLPPLTTLCRFELDFLGELGLFPALESCASCGRVAPPVPPTLRRGPEPRVAFSAGAGGRLCHACAAALQQAGRRVGTLPQRVLEAAAALHQPATRTLQGDEPVRVHDFLARFIEFHLESRPKSYKTFLATPNRNGPPLPTPKDLC